MRRMYMRCMQASARSVFLASFPMIDAAAHAAVSDVARSAQLTKQCSTAAEADQFGDLRQGPFRFAYQAYRGTGSLAIQIGRGRHAVEGLESPQEVKRRQVRCARHVFQPDRLAEMRVDERHAEPDAPVELATSRGFGRGDELASAPLPALEPQHATEQEVQLLLDPAVLARSRVDGLPDMAQDGCDRPVMFPQPLVELDRVATIARGVHQQCLRGPQQRVLDLLRESRPEKDRE